ncbi:hypothetical protein [Oricola sp.]|uniref:hypothetical protein n=1 Tax=Oricola sp. TaxID=1979950 RepID=UPI0035128ABA
MAGISIEKSLAKISRSRSGRLPKQGHPADSVRGRCRHPRRLYGQSFESDLVGKAAPMPLPNTQLDTGSGVAPKSGQARTALACVSGRIRVIMTEKAKAPETGALDA